MPQRSSSRNSSLSEHAAQLVRLIQEEAQGAFPGYSRWEIPVKQLFSKYRDRYRTSPPEEPGLSFESLQSHLLKGIWSGDVRIGYNAFTNALLFERVPSPETLERFVEISDGRFWNELNERISSLNGFQFQTWVAEVLRSLPWVEKVVETRLTADEGVDFTAWIDDEALGKVLAIGQVKKTAKKIGAPPIRDFVGTLVSARPLPKVGIFVSLAGFTEPGVRAIEAAPVHIRTVDGHELVDWLCRYEIGVRRRQLPVLSLDSNFWNEISGI